MCTDGANLDYDVAFLDTLNEPTTLTIVAHEVMHCALGHHTRRAGRDPELWNIACDHVVNLVLQKAGFVIPETGYCDPQYDGLNAEEVYRILDAKRRQEQPQPEPEEQPAAGQSGDEESDDASQQGDEPKDDGSDDDGDGTDESDVGGDGDGEGDQDGDDQAAGGNGDGGEAEDGDGQGDGSQSGGKPQPGPCPDPGRCGGVIDAAPEHDQAALSESADEWEVAVRQAVNMARRQGEGKLPGFLEEVVDQIAAPQHDWRAELRAWVTTSSTKDYTWAKPNRRMLPLGYITPGTTDDGVGHVGFVIDTSASLNNPMLAKLGGEMQGCLDDGAVDKITVVFCDTDVRAAAEYVKGDVIDFTPIGRGGTRFAPAFVWFNEHAPDIDGLIFMTDLQCCEYGPEPEYPTLWAAIGDPRDLKTWMARVPFGECMEIT
jgi:predicted metal-dependent peptidase